MFEGCPPEQKNVSAFAGRPMREGISGGVKMPDGKGTSRRSFLKIGGAAALLTTLDQAAEAAESSPSAPENEKRASAKPQPAAGGARLVDLANPLQGTDSTSLFSRGNTLPIVAVPFAMAHWALESSDGNAWFFQPRDQRLEGIRCTHQLSPWLRDYGHATFLPFSGDPSPEPSARASSYRPEELRISPHSLKLRLTRYRCFLELAPTERCSVMRVTFQDSGAAGVLIDLPGEDAEARCETANGTITALTRANSGGVPAGFAAYYVLRTDARIAGFEVKELKDRRVAMVRFAAQAEKPVTLRVGTSFISHEQAARNLDGEVGEKPFDQVKREAAAVWEEALGRVRIQGGTETQRKIFYSSLYRALLFPRTWHERDAQGNFVHYSAFSGKVEPGVMYADHGYWDVYRAWYPMMALVYPERLSQILEAWVNAYKEGGWLPQFPCPGYRNCMTGSPLDFVFGDAVAKGIQGFDVQAAYAALKKHATQPVAPGLGYGRPAVAEYEKLGFIPCDVAGDGVAETLDSAYGDFCIAQVARVAGMHEDAAMFETRSRNWRNIFDAKTRFLRGKLANGSWLEPFNPHAWGGAYVEGSAWQYRFSVPYDPQGLIEAMGGRAAFLGYLEEMLSQPPIFHVGSYGREIHEMSEMAAVDFGQYAHSNQTVHHALYLFTVAGRRDRTQYWAHRVLNELYSVENFPGDEDTGSMGAWYVLSALGIFSLCPGKPEWVLGAPLFEQAEIRHPDGREVRIEAHSKKAGAFFDRVTLNGVEHKEPSVQHSELVKGARLVFTAS
jgi:predicted alpha-1,2-mannosidase